MATFSWEPTNAPVMSQGGRTDDIWFSSASTGWAVNSNGQILQTTDAGASWQEQARYPKSYLRCMTFAGHLNGWVGTVTATNRLIATTDGGKTWNPVAGLPPQPTAICGIHAVNEQVVYAAGTNWPNRPAAVLKTSDGGKTWTVIDMSKVASLLVDIYFVSPDKGWVVGGFGGKTRDTVRPVVLHTADGGETWHNQLVGIQGTLPFGEWGWKIQFLNSTVGFVSLENFTAGAILRTDDGGITWRRLPINDPQGNANLEGIGFLDERNGWVGGWGDKDFSGGYTSQTNDGGATWKNANQIGKFINRFRFLGSPVTVGFASGDTVYRYSDAHPLAPLALADAKTTPKSLVLNRLDEVAADGLHLRVNVANGTQRLDIDVWDRFGAHVATAVAEDQPLPGFRDVVVKLPHGGEAERSTHYIYRVSADQDVESRIVTAVTPTDVGNDAALRARSGDLPPPPLPTVDEEKEAFHKIANIEDFPTFRPAALAMAGAYLLNADYSASPLYEKFSYSESAFDLRMKEIYEAALPDMYQPHRYDQEVIGWSNGKRYRVGKASDAVVRDRLLQMAPFNLLDGAWLQSLTQARPADEVQSRLFSIWSDEVGNGEAEHNHSNVYQDLLRSQGIYLPEVTSRSFLDIDVAPGAWRSPVFQMSIGLFPQHFFPEILGMTLFLEWEATPTLNPAVTMLRNRGMNPLFYALHVAIDNISQGHGALAKEAIKIFLDDKREEGGESAVQESWSRIWNGYVAWATAGFNGQGLEERRLLIDGVAINLGTPEAPQCFPDFRGHFAARMKALIEAKAPYARQVHGHATLGGVNLNHLFDAPDELLRILVETRMVDPERPRQSKFLDLLSFNGPMYKVFTEADVAVVLDWIESLGRQLPGCIDPLPDTSPQDPLPDRVVAIISVLAGRAKKAHDKLVLPSADGGTLPLVDLFDQPVALMEALVRGGWIVPGDPDASIFLTRVLLGGGPMEGVLDTTALDTVRAWIESGAMSPGTADGPPIVLAAMLTERFDESRSKSNAARHMHRSARPFIGQGAVH